MKDAAAKLTSVDPSCYQQTSSISKPKKREQPSTQQAATWATGIKNG
jgi:hypothetical protein